MKARAKIWQINASNIILKSRFSGLQRCPTIRLYTNSFSSCWLSNQRNSAKFSENSNL